MAECKVQSVLSGQITRHQEARRPMLARANDESTSLTEQTASKPIAILPDILVRPVRKPARPGFVGCRDCGAELTNFGRNPVVLSKVPLVCPRCFGVSTYAGRKQISSYFTPSESTESSPD